MAISYRVKRPLVLERRERIERVKELRWQVRTCVFWRWFLHRYVLPVMLLLFFGWSLGFVAGTKFASEQIETQFACVPKVRHGD